MCIKENKEGWNVENSNFEFALRSKEEMLFFIAISIIVGCSQEEEVRYFQTATQMLLCI